MTDLTSIPQQARERIGQIGDAELVVGILDVHGSDAPGGDSSSGENGDGVSLVRDAVAALSQVPKTVVIHSNSNKDHVSGNGSAAPIQSVQSDSFIEISDPAFGMDPSIASVQSM